MNQTKICTKCNQEKQLTEFYKKISGKYGIDSICKCCKKLYYQNNQDAITERHKQWRDNNLEYYKQYYQNDKERRLKYQNQYNQDNQESRSEYAKQYYQTAKGKAVKKATAHNRRAHKQSNGGKHTGAEILALFDLQSGVCPYCEVKLYKTGKNIFHTDHITPLSKGGTNDISNIQLLCAKCNLSKHDKLPEEFALQFNKLI